MELLELVRGAILCLRQYKDFKSAVCFSGGKDSLVALDLSIRAGIDNVVYCNTGIEYDETSHYIRSIEDFYGIKVETLEPNKSFFELMEYLGFPSRRSRWCCEILKFAPLANYAKKNNISAFILGTRKVEHTRRRKYSVFSSQPLIPVEQINPILEWETKHVWEYIKKYSLPINPLYDMGRSRVGCWPCPFNSKDDWKLLKGKFPEKYELLKEKIFECIEKFGRIGIRNTYDFIDNQGWTGYAWPQISRVVGSLNKKNEHEIELQLERMFDINRVEKMLPIIGKNKRYGTTFLISSDSIKTVIKAIERAINCIGCGACVSSCPNDALYIRGNNLCVNEEKCTGCKNCFNNSLRSNCIMRNYAPVKKVIGVSTKISNEYTLRNHGDIGSFNTKISLEDVRNYISNHVKFVASENKIIIKDQKLNGVIKKEGKFTKVIISSNDVVRDLRKVRELLSSNHSVYQVKNIHENTC